jgi:hypothetical protein
LRKNKPLASSQRAVPRGEEEFYGKLPGRSSGFSQEMYLFLQPAGI